MYAIGAVGLTLVYGILKLVNFAHGDFLTFGAYMAFLVNVTWGAPLVVAALAAIVMTALLGIFFERVMWEPMRARKAGLLQLLLMSIGLAFLIRYSIQYVWGTEIRFLDVDNVAVVEFLGLRIGRTELIVIGRRHHRDARGRARCSGSPCSASGCARLPTTSTSPRPPASTPRG